jgi:hypothetical protein
MVRESHEPDGKVGDVGFQGLQVEAPEPQIFDCGAAATFARVETRGR